MYYNKYVMSMQEIFSNFYNYVIRFVDSLGIYGPLLGSLLITFESIIPVLPLFVFITMNFIAFGKIVGFIISWLCTIIGCIISYWLVKRFLRGPVVKRYGGSEVLGKCMNYIENLSLQKVTVILAIPFTPAFMMNIAAGLCNMNFKKFLVSITISKIFLVYFWGFVGTGLVDSFKNPQNLIIVVIIMLSAYLISFITKKIFKLD